ncbi:hypothetical protein EHZ19_31175 [Paraburkholderia bannensis]|nr:hypothetical protein [Paraburkholderia bannensis]RQM43992.1 hypothetical protein EHZ19_31175 [Paraburkholderia bannensis]
MIETNTQVFARLAEVASSALSPELISQKRAIATNDHEKKWLKNAEIFGSSYMSFGVNSSFSIVVFGRENYILSIGVSIENPPPDFEVTPVNAGIFTAIVSDLSVGFIISTDIVERLVEYVFYPTSDAVERIDVDVIRPFFLPLQLFRIHPESPLNCDRSSSFRISLAAVLGTPSLISLPWPQTALERINGMVRNPDERTPFHLLLRALTETRPDAAFLAIYRCIEQLFPIPKIAELSADLKLNLAAMDVAIMIERHLSWRRREDEAITYLFEQVSVDAVTRLGRLFPEIQAGEISARTVSRRVYELRNHCVHYRPVHASVVDAQTEWMKISDVLLEIAEQLYGAYNTAFSSEA